jgi:glycosyltransferase involved in cell wall biosynthesis
MISIICPFYNEEAILEKSVELMLRNLDKLEAKWELIIVNDGSTDGSLNIAKELENSHTNLKVCTYTFNKGRGFAIRAGIAHAQGKIVVTTEIDSSWGDYIVYRIVQAFKEHPDADMVIASPHLPEGGYKNVPFKRVFLSKFGNRIIRTSLTNRLTMNTGMTRGYLRDKFLALPLDEDGKEMHLEIVSKALAFNYSIYEIPAKIEWKTDKLKTDEGKVRKSSSKINNLIGSHLMFSMSVAPFRYIFPVSGILGTLSLVAFGIAIYKLFTPDPTIYWLITSFFLALFGFVFFGVGLLARQNREIMGELWRVRSLIQEKEDYDSSRIAD